MSEIIIVMYHTADGTDFAELETDEQLEAFNETHDVQLIWTEKK